MELIIAILAFVVSTVTAVWTLRHNREQVQFARLANVTSIIEVERSLGSVPAALRFHGITEQSLRDAGVTAEEFAYLVSNCSATGVYHNFSREDPNEPFAVDSYRYSMCATPEFRRAWPLVRSMLNKGIFVGRMDATIAAVEARERTRQA